MSLRIIPTIIVDSGATYHTIKFKKNLYLGDPINICRIYNEKNCDEIRENNWNWRLNGIEIKVDQWSDSKRAFIRHMKKE